MENGKFEMKKFLGEIEARGELRSAVVKTADQVLKRIGNKYDMSKVDLDELHDTVVDAVAERANSSTESVPELELAIIAAVEKHVGPILGEGLNDFLRDFREDLHQTFSSTQWEVFAD
ncbi:MAG: hypothetical protein RLZZ416_388 [Candidatus Parcubacteria bacterium]|jgi:hypothetical protein